MSVNAIAFAIVLWVIKIVGVVSTLAAIFWLFAPDKVMNTYEAYWILTFVLFFIVHGLLAMFKETREWVKENVNL